MGAVEGVAIRQSDVDEMRDAVSGAVVDETADVIRELLGDASTPAEVVAAMSVPGSASLSDATKEAVLEYVRDAVRGMDDYHREQFRRAVAAGAGVEASSVESVDIDSTRDNFAETVSAAVTSLPERSRQRVLDAAVSAAIADGGFEDLGFDDAGAMVGHVLSSSANIARESAGSEAGSYISAANEARASVVGVEGYVWQTQEDAQVRPSHEANNGQVFEFVAPPATGNPGRDWGCRCIAVIDVPDGFRDVGANDVSRGGVMKRRSLIDDPGYRRVYTRAGKHGVVHLRQSPEPCRVRQAEDDENVAIIYGLGLKWDTPAKVWGEWEQFRRGCFAETIRNDEQFLFFGHNYDLPPFDSTEVGMTLAEGEIGLDYAARVERVGAGLDFIRAVERGIVRHASIGFSWAADYEYEHDYEDGDGLVTYTNVKRLYEVSGTQWPVHESSEMDARARLQDGGGSRELARERLRLLAHSYLEEAV